MPWNVLERAPRADERHWRGAGRRADSTLGPERQGTSMERKTKERARDLAMRDHVARATVAVNVARSALARGDLAVLDEMFAEAQSALEGCRTELSGEHEEGEPLAAGTTA